MGLQPVDRGRYPRDQRWPGVLRTELGLTGTKFGCGMDVCGACTVLINQKSERSCVYPLRAVKGKDVVTIEGLARNGELHPLQQAFADNDARTRSTVS